LKSCQLPHHCTKNRTWKSMQWVTLKSVR